MKLKKILYLFFAYSINSYSGVMINNIDLRYYIDFANNTGLFKPGSSDINIYYKDFDKTRNSLSGGYVNNGELKNVVAKGIPMADFSSVFRFKGTGTLVDAQYTQSNSHTTQNRGGYNTYGSVNHYDSKNIENDIKRIHSGSLGAKGSVNYSADINNDESFKAFWKNQFDLDISRVNKLVTDVAPANLMDFGESAERYDANGNRLADSKSSVIANKFKNGEITHFYRLGGGNQYSDGVKLSGPYSFLTGGVYTNPDDKYSGGYVARVFRQADAQWRIAKDGLYGKNDKQLGMPIVTLGGDSGSPIFGYSPADNIWYLLGTLHGSQGNTNTYSPVSKSELEYYKKFFQADAIINDGNEIINWSNGILTQKNNKWEYKTLKQQDIGTLVNKINNIKLNNTEDIIFSGENTNIVVQENINTGAGSVTFNNDYIIKGGSDDISYMGAGLIINGKSKVNWGVKGVEGDNLHKLGSGTLIIDGVGANKGGLRIGDGIAYLNQKGNKLGEKQAFKEVILASGRATVVLGDSKQIKGKDVTFAFRGGALDLNGNDISFDRIRHVDDGATITNKNTTLKSNLYIDGGVLWSDKKYKQVYKGFFGERDSIENGMMDINFYTKIDDDLLVLSGGSNINGNLNTKKGNLVLTGSPVFFSTLYNNNISSEANKLGLNKNYIKDIVEMKTYKADKFNVTEGAKFELGYSTNTYGDIHASNSDIIIGKVKSKKNTICVDMESAKLPSCYSNESDLSKFYSLDALDIYFSGNVYLKNKTNYLMGLSLTKGSLYDLGDNSSLTMENGAKFILEGSDNNINELKMNDSHIILGGNVNSNLKVGILSSKNSDFSFNINTKGNENYLLLIGKLIDSEVKLNVERNADINNPIDYTKKIMIASIDEVKNSHVSLNDSDVDIGLYKFKINDKNNGNGKIYYLESAKGPQKNIISDLTNDIVISQSATNNLIEKHIFSSLNGFKKNDKNDGLWLSSELGRIWYKSKESYRDFNQNHNEFSIGYNYVLSKGIIGVSYSNIDSNINKSTPLKSNYFNFYGKHHLNDTSNIYLMASIGENKVKVNSLNESKKRKNITQGYLIGVSNDFYSNDNFTANIYLDAAMLRSKIKNNHSGINFNINTNYWLSSGLEMNNSIKSDYIKQYDFVFKVGYSHNLSSDDEIIIQSQSFKVEKNKYNLNINSGVDFKINDRLTPYISMDLSVGDKYSPETQANVGIRYIF